MPPLPWERTGGGQAEGAPGASGCEGQLRGQCVCFAWLAGKTKTFNPFSLWVEWETGAIVLECTRQKKSCEIFLDGSAVHLGDDLGRGSGGWGPARRQAGCFPRQHLKIKPTTTPLCSPPPGIPVCLENLKFQDTE